MTAPPRILTVRGSGDLERLLELANRQRRIADGLAHDIQTQGLTPGAAAEVALRECRHRREHERLMAAARKFQATGEQVSIDLNAEDATA